MQTPQGLDATHGGKLFTVTINPFPAPADCDELRLPRDAAHPPVRPYVRS